MHDFDVRKRCTNAGGPFNLSLTKSLKHNNDPERKIWTAASKYPLAFLLCQAGMDSAAATDT